MKHHEQLLKKGRKKIFSLLARRAVVSPLASRADIKSFVSPATSSEIQSSDSDFTDDS
jgi:hypothetical protein